MNIFPAMIPAFFWGTTYAVTQFTVSDWPPLLLGALRALPAGIILFMIKPNFPKKGEWLNLLSLGTINIACFFSLIYLMANELPAAISGVGMVSVPVFAMLFHMVVHKRSPSTVQVISGASLVALAWFLFSPGSIQLSAVGLLAMLGAICCIVIGSDITQRLGSRMHWWNVLTWQLIIGGVLLSIATLVHGLFEPTVYVNAISNIDMLNLQGLVWLAVVNTAFAYGMYVWLLQKMTVVEFTFGGITNPVAGILTGFILLGESFTQQQYLLMIAMILTSLAPQIVHAVGERMPSFKRS